MPLRQSDMQRLFLVTIYQPTLEELVEAGLVSSLGEFKLSKLKTGEWVASVKTKNKGRAMGISEKSALGAVAQLWLILNKKE